MKSNKEIRKPKKDAKKPRRPRRTLKAAGAVPAIKIKDKEVVAISDLRAALAAADLRVGRAPRFCYARCAAGATSQRRTDPWPGSICSSPACSRSAGPSG